MSLLGVRLSTAIAALLASMTSLALAPAPAAIAGEESAGTRVSSFLAIGTGPAVVGRGGATFAIGSDLQSAALNPAALGGIDAGRFAFSHATLEGSLTHEWAAYGGRLRGGPIRYGVSGVLRDEGTIEGRDEFNQPTTTAEARSWALSFQLARPLGSWLVLGGAARWVGERIGESGGDGLAFDAGAQARTGPLSFGLAAQNFGGGMNWGGQRWSMPASFGGGVALEHAASGLRLVLDLAAPADYYRSARVGAEWRWQDRFALRGGYRREIGAPAEDRLNGPAFGLGAGVGPMWVDYGFVSPQGAEAQHRIGLDLRRLGPAAEAGTPGPAGSGSGTTGK